MKKLAQSGPNTMTPQHKPAPGVKNMAPGPQTKSVGTHPATPAPNKGQTGTSKQSGSTNPQTERGGGVGNSAADLQGYLGRK